MTPAEIETAARNNYNATNDTFYTTAEILYWIYEAQQILAAEGWIIERVYSTTSVADQQEYAFPTNTIAVKRITYNGNKLHPIQFREDDALTLNNSTTTSSGTPVYYSQWNFTMYLRPIPAATADTIEVFSINMPEVVTLTSAIEVPLLFHMDIVNYVTGKMAAKDQNTQMMAFYFGPQGLWPLAIVKAKKWKRRMKRGDSFATVIDEETIPMTILGGV